MADFGFEIKHLFFDRQAVRRKLKPANAKALSRAGAFVRTSARTSIRRRKAVSAPDSPPSAHAKHQPNLKTIFFGYDPKTESVVVGPVRLNGSSSVRVPRILELGGDVTITQVLVGKAWLTGKKPTNPRQPTRKKTVKYAARPFMNPALVANQSKIPSLWANSVR
jgi:hypothetical protein